MVVLSASRTLEAADPQSYTVTIDKTDNPTLDGALNDTSTLVSLRENAPVGPFALVARAQSDAARFESALHSFGFYKGRASIRIAGRPLDDPDLPDFLDHAPATPVPVTVTIDRGPLFHLRQVDLRGRVPEAAREKLGLAPGAPAIAGDVLAAGGRLLTTLQEQGYALAKVSDPAATLVPQSNELDVAYTVETGPRVDIGQITLNGLDHMNESFVRHRLRLRSGEQYSPSSVEAARKDLASLGVFATVRARAADRLDPEGRIPVTFEMAERPLHAVNFSVAYSTDLGATASVTWQHRNLFGNAEQLNLTAGVQGGGSAVRRPGYNAGVQFIKPDFLARDQALQVDLTALKQSLEAYDQKAVIADVLLNRKFSEHWSGSIGLAAEQERITQERESRTYSLLGVPIGAKYDNTDSLFDPTEGIRASASVTPTQSFGHSTATFVLLQVGGSTYYDLSSLWGEKGRSILALRATVGDALGATQFELPPDKRFYAGGSATVRGYRYQSIGPRFADNRPQGGVALAAGTVEFRQRILESYGVVAFVDAGQVAASGAPFSGNWAMGAGIGARYYTPIGPIRVDVAVPLTHLPRNDAVALYIGIGHAF